MSQRICRLAALWRGAKLDAALAALRFWEIRGMKMHRPRSVAAKRADENGDGPKTLKSPGDVLSTLALRIMRVRLLSIRSCFAQFTL